MSIISASQSNKPPSLVGSVRNGSAGSTFSGNNNQANASITSKSLPFNAITIPSSSGKRRVLGDQELTEEELEHLADVCRRYEQLQRQEDERVKLIRDKAIAREKARRGISRFDDAHCALCSAAFMALINTKSLCLQCDRNVCRNCVQNKSDNNGVLCKACFTECSNKARTGLWFTEKLQIAKKDGRIISIAPTSALRASINRKRKERSAASSVVGKPPTPKKQNDPANDPVQEAARRLTKDGDKDSSLPTNLTQRPPLVMAPASGAEQLAFNVIFSGVDNLPKTIPRSRSRQNSSSGYNTPILPTGGNAGSISEGLNTNTWDNRSMISSISVGSVTSVYSEREESFTHGIMIKGDLSFSVDYDDKSGTLRIFIKQAREIAVADKKTNTSNTYVKTYLLPDKAKASKRKTKVKKNTTNPVFNETLIYNNAKSDLAYRTLQLSVWHYQHLKANLFLGEVLVPLADYRFSSTPIWRALQSRNALGGAYEHNLTKGQVRLGLKYLPGSQDDGELHVYVKNAIDLNVLLGASASNDNKDSINPFVKTYLLPERPKDSKRKTKVIKKSNNPTWEETLVYKGIAKTQLPSIGVEVVIWDANTLGPHEYLGGCNLNTGSRSGYGMDATGIERALWVEMMSKPNTLVEGSVQLRSIMV